jgi:antitoxin HicB
MRSFPVRVIPGDQRSVLLLFPDIPEAVVVGDSEDEAFDRAQSVLDDILKCYVAAGREIPQPSDICGAPLVTTSRF